MAVDFQADPYAEMQYLTDLGVDGFFTDCPHTAAAWRRAAGMPQQRVEQPRVSATCLQLPLSCVEPCSTPVLLSVGRRVPWQFKCVW